MRREIKSFLFFTVGVAFLALGLAFLTQSGLGTSPLGSPMWVLTLQTSISFGLWNLIFNVGFILSQWALLRKDFPMWYWVQLPIAAIFSLFIDGSIFLIEPFAPSAYWAQFIFMLAGVFFVALGVALEVATAKYFLPGEGVVSAISKVFGWRFSRVKIGFDVVLVTTALILAFIMTGGIIGVREGTVIAAVFTGLIVGRIQNPVDVLYDKLVGTNPPREKNDDE